MGEILTSGKRTGQGFVLMYSITSRSSFEEAHMIHEQLLRVKDADWVPMVGILDIFRVLMGLIRSSLAINVIWNTRGTMMEG